MIVNTKQAIKILAKGLGLESLSNSAFTSYCAAGLVPEKINPNVGPKEAFLFQESDIILAIDNIKKHKAKRKFDLIIQNRAKTRRARENAECKEPKNYTNAFSLFNKRVL